MNRAPKRSVLTGPIPRSSPNAERVRGRCTAIWRWHGPAAGAAGRSAPRRCFVLRRTRRGGSLAVVAPRAAVAGGRIAKISEHEGSAAALGVGVALHGFELLQLGLAPLIQRLPIDLEAVQVA